MSNESTLVTAVGRSPDVGLMHVEPQNRPDIERQKTLNGLKHSIWLKMLMQEKQTRASCVYSKRFVPKLHLKSKRKEHAIFNYLYHGYSLSTLNHVAISTAYGLTATLLTFL